MAFFSNSQRPIGQILVDSGFVGKQDLELALEEQKRTNELLGQVLVRLGVLDKMDLDAALSIQGHLGKLEDAVRSAAGIRQMLGSLLLMSGRITEEQLDFALAEQKATNEKLGDILVRLGLLSDRQIGSVLEFQRNQEKSQEGKSPLRLGEILVSVGTITRAQLDDALRKQALSQKKLGEILVEEGYAEQQHIDKGIHIQQKLVQAALVTVISLAGMSMQGCGGGGTAATSEATGGSVVAAGAVGITVTAATLLGGAQVTAINKTLPSQGAVEVNVSSAITVFFNNEMDESSINSATFKVAGPDGAISGTVVYDRTSNTAVFTPIAPLMPQAEYTATVAKETMEKSGKTLTDNASWKFKTGKDFLARSPEDVVPRTLFGQHMHRAATTTVWPATPFGAWRLWDAAVTWNNLEPSKSEWHFETLENYVSMAELHNVEVVLPLGLSPKWASARPDEISSYGPGNAAEPANIEDWKNYVRTVATKYKGRIHYYELWNEVNLSGFYSGSVDQMLTMAKEAYQIIKSIDPSASVVSPSCVASDSRIAWFEEYLKKGGGQYADIIGYHFYVSPNAPEQMVPFIGKVKQIIADNNLSGKPLWNTESGWYIENHNSTVAAEGSFSKVLTDSEASAYVARSYVLNWASGVNRFFWYAWDNNNMGFVEKDGKTVKAPATAYAQTYNWLNGAKMISCGKNNQGTWVIRLVKSDNKAAWIVWNADNPVNMDLPREWNAKSMKNLAGNVSSVASVTQLEISQSPILIEQ
jgi:hypothetical protein